MAACYDAFVFDMDGTILYTLDDLTAATNAMLKTFGYPERTREDVRFMVGDGTRALIERAIPADASRENIDELYSCWISYYDTHGDEHTRPYDGIVETMRDLRARGKKIGVLSNKYQAGVDAMIARFFDGLVDCAIGDGTAPRKPDPTGLIMLAERIGTPLDRIAYFGDSMTDMRTTVRAGVFGIGVTWGYQTREAIADAGARTLIDTPSRILDFA